MITDARKQQLREMGHAEEIIQAMSPEAAHNRLSIAGGKLQGTFELTNLADAEEMIRAVNAWKILLKPAADIKRPDEEETAN